MRSKNAVWCPSCGRILESTFKEVTAEPLVIPKHKAYEGEDCMCHGSLGEFFSANYLKGLKELKKFAKEIKKEM